MAENVNKNSNRPFISIRWQMLISFGLLFLVMFTGGYFWFLQYATAQAEADIQRELEAIATRAAEGIDGDTHQALIEDFADYEVPNADENPDDPRLTQVYWGVDDARYQELSDWLALVKESQGTVTYEQEGKVQTSSRVFVYSYVPSDAAGEVLFVGSAGAVNDPPSGAKISQPYSPQSEQMLNGLDFVDSNVSEVITDEWGAWYSGFAPIENSEGELVGAVGVDMLDTTVAAIRRQVRDTLIPIFVAAGLTGLAIAAVISFSITRPILALTGAAELVAEGNYAIDDLDLNPVVEDETETLTTVFKQMVDKVRAREEKLKRQVDELRIMVDKGKQEEQVSEIVDSDFFRDLRAKATDMRSRTTGKTKKEDTDEAAKKES